MIPLPTTLPIARYRFTAIVQQPLQLPAYAGSLLRGQFGAALRSVACMTRAPTCGGCPLLQTCPYSRIFEAPPPPKGQHALQDFSQIPNPYIMEPPAPFTTPGSSRLGSGDALVFCMVLVGQALDQLPLIIFALQRALGQGLSKARVPADLVQVDYLDSAGTALPVWQHDHPALAEHTPSLTLNASNFVAHYALSTVPVAVNNAELSPNIADTGDASVVLHITTPLRLQHQGRPLGVGQLSPRALVAGIARRTALLMEFHAGQEGWGQAAKEIIRLSDTLRDTQDLRWHDWTRYSSRQQQAMTLGGVLGRWTLHADDPATLTTLWPWLWLGQWLHVGKNATMGMGAYTLETPATT